MKPKPIRLYFRVAMMLLMLLTSAQMATAQEAAVYDLVTEVPTVDDGQATNWDTEYDYYSLVDGNTSTIYGISNANPWVEFHYSRAFVPKKYILWTGDIYPFAYNPATWTIKAKLNKTDEWTTLATVDNSSGNQLPENEHVSKEFSIVENTKAYKYFRFEATRRNNGTFQLGELQFKEATPKVELTWNMSDQSSMQYTISGNSADFVSNGNTMRYTWTGTPGWNLWGSAGYYFHKAIENQLQVTFPYLTGKVTKVEINNINFSPAGMSLSVSNGTANLKNGNSDYLASTDDTSGSSVTFTGEIDVNTSNYLRFTFVKTASGNVSNQRFDFMNNGTIKVTLVKEKKADLGHTFTSIIASGNVLTATCTSTDADHVALYGASHHFTLTLNAADGMAEPSRPVYATITPAVSDFNEDTQLGATCTVEYAPQGTSQGCSSWTTSAPYVAGNYTARATIRINNTNYVLTTNFSVIEGHYVTNNYPQFSVNKTGAMAGENITVTFTPKMGESVATLTVTGDNTSLSLDNGISDNGDNTYTFAMPNENVTLGGTFTFPMNADNFAQDGDTYTIKNADGWDYFCQRIQYDANIDGFSGKTIELAADNITVTTMAGMMHPFKGTFDGKGNTLDFSYTADGPSCAPFQNTNGATICNLHVEGTITGGVYSYLGGLIGSSEGDLTIRDCHVSTQISTKYDSNTLSSNVGIGGIVGYIHYTTYDQKCQITGCVYDGLIYNPNYSGTTYGCGGFVGCLSDDVYVELTDCLFIEGQYDNNGGKHELLWGHDNNKNSTFFHRTNNQGEGKLTNCFFVATHFLKQGSPAVESATAPTNFAHFGDPTTDHRFLKVYGHTMVLDNKYYTPTYGDLVEEYDYGGGKSYNIEYDDKPLGIPDITTQLWVPLLRYKRTFTNGKPVTVMMPFNFTKSAFKKSGSSDGLTGHFYEFKGIHLDPQTSKWVAVMGEPDNPETTTMKANTPYLYVPDDEPQYWYIDNGGSGVNIFTEGYDGGNKVTPYDGFEMRGTYTEKVWEENDPEIGKAYLIGDGGELIPVTAGTKIRPTECYIIQTAWATDKTLSGSESYEAQDGDVLTGTTSGTVTIANNAKITLSDVTITGGIVCAGTAEITLVGMNSVTGASQKAGIQVGGLGTTLTIKGNGSLTANGGDQSAGIGLSRAWKPANDVIGGDIIIEGGDITANGSVNNQWGAGIGTGVIYYGDGSAKTARIGNITIKGGSVKATGGSEANGIGTGYTYNGCTNTIGTVTIYDGIDKVDASSIKDFNNVIYMHGETNVTANKSDYFTIIEDGNRRVIAPKDDTDYTITIANGIEHGTLTGAATAKYMEEVTITATPDFGYCLSRLVVKDAQNNDVESTDNSFFMPKSNVTVSAVFEQGTHGTTEFKWFYKTGPEPEDIVLETIYDGVTTVNIQNRGMMYRIWKYEGNTDYQFLLDNNTGDANIPYAGGTGEFYESGNPTTNFVFPYDGETGYYDITMTDVGNGKWNVSILKTAGQMDVVPDQTYTGSAITPEPTVIAGSFNLTKGTDYVYSYTNNTNVGTAKVRATFQGTYAWLGYVEKEFTILPSTVIVNVTGNGTVTYNDKVATNGEVIGVVADKGTDVTLTLAPENGYAVSIEYGYTNSGTTASGFKLPINGTTATLTVPNDLKDGTYVNLTVSFVSALAGGADEVSAVALTDNTVTNFAGGWYKVDSNITFDHTLNLLGDTHLIIDDGKTMTVNTATSEGILSDYTLFVSGEGTLSVATTAGDGIAVCVGNYVQTGATVTVNGYIGIRCYDSFDTLGFDNDFTFSGGQLTATGSGGGGIWADNDITLSCTNATDFIQASSYSSVFSAVKIAEGKALTDGTVASNGMNGYSGTLTYEQRTAIGGKTLRRAVITSYVDASGTLHENVIAIPLDNTMTTLAAGWYVVNCDVAYTGTMTLSGNVTLILGDGKTMSVTNTGTGNEDFAIYGDSGSLHIYGQSQGTGALTATANSSVTIKVDDYITINGGTVTATSTSDVGIYGIDGVTINGGTVNANGIYADGDITINGGKVTSTSDSGIRSNNGTIILGLSNATDYITAESYNGAVKVADGQTLVDDGGNIWSGTLSNDQIGDINGRTLRPFKTITLADNADNSSTISEWSGGVAEVTLSGRTLYKDGAWNTLCLPISLSAEQIAANTDFAGATLMTMDVTKKNGFDVEDGTLYLWFKTATTIEAGVPYLVKWEKAANYEGNEANYDISNPVFEGVTVSSTAAQAVESTTAGLESVQMVGTYSPVGVTADDKSILFLGDANTLYYSTTDRQIRSCRAYFSVPYINGHAEAKARAFALSFDGEETTGILEVSANYNGVTDEAWYSLDGVRLSGKPTQRGMYINKGKKILVK